MPCQICGRPSCRPPEYPPLCAKHYLAHVTDLRKRLDAEARNR